jgi:hypothetical protein
MDRRKSGHFPAERSGPRVALVVVMTASHAAWTPSLVFVALVAGAGCVSSAEEEEPGPPIEGVFRLETADANAAIEQVEFRDGHYGLLPSGCTEESCTERGTFTVDRPSHAIDLVVQGTGRKYRLPFEVTSTRRGTGLAGPATPSTFAGPLAPVGDSLVAGDQQTVENGQQLAGQSQLTVGSIKLVGQSYLLDYDNCYGSTNDALRIAIGICNGNKEPTKSPRIKCILMNDQDHCNGASKQSCLQDTSENDALSRYDQYGKACRDSGDIARETEASFNNGLNKFVMTVCCSTYTCAGGVRIDGSAVTGQRGETVCGQDGTKWWCGPGGQTEGVGQWKNLGVACSR